MKDIIAFSKKTCSCGINTQILEGIYGRKRSTIFLPDGKKVYFYTLLKAMSEQMFENDYDIIFRLKLIQKKPDKVEFRIKFYEKSDIEPRIKNKIFFDIKSSFTDLFGSDVKIDVKETKKLSMYDAMIVSNVNKT